MVESGDPFAPAQDEAAVRPRRRRTAQQLQDDILTAAGDLMLERGLSGFTIEGVAARAGASKMSVYKWWPSKTALALSGYAARIDTLIRCPDTGSLAEDLTLQLTYFLRYLNSPHGGPIMAELMVAARQDPELAERYRATFTLPRRALGLVSLQRAVERGEVRADIDPETVLDQLWGACLYHYLVMGTELTAEYAATLVDNLMPGLRP